MAHKVDPKEIEHGLGGRRTMRKTKYPWEEWADGDWWKLTEGEDFTTTVRGFVSTVHNHAARSGMTAETHLTDGGLYVRFTRQADRSGGGA